MKTAVEFLLRELENKFSNEMQNIYSKNMQLVANICEQAKEMEKEQMCKFASDYVETQCSASFDGSVSVDITTEEYYNLTFKSK
jgi:hypothetical protein